MNNERLVDTHHVGDHLWNKAVQELGSQCLGLVLAYQAGRADAARVILEKDQRHTHDAALDIMLEASDTWEDNVEC